MRGHGPEHVYKMGAREPLWTRHDVGGLRADHGRKHEPGADDDRSSQAERTASDQDRTAPASCPTPASLRYPGLRAAGASRPAKQCTLRGLKSCMAVRLTPQTPLRKSTHSSVAYSTASKLRYRSPPVDDLGLAEAVDRLGERIVETVADAADGGFDASLGEPLRVANGKILRSAVRMRHQARTLCGGPLVDRLLESVEDETRMGCPADAPGAKRARRSASVGTAPASGQASIRAARSASTPRSWAIASAPTTSLQAARSGRASMATS